MSADDSTRRRLMFIFSTSIATTYAPLPSPPPISVTEHFAHSVVSLAHAALIFEDAGMKVVITTMVENGVSLMVCNVPELATAALRALGRHDAAGDRTYMRFGSRLRFSASVFSRKTARTGTKSVGAKSGTRTKTRAITLTGLSSVTDESTRDEGKDEYDLGGGGAARKTELAPAARAERDQKVMWGVGGPERERP
jgi:hypothetical protein